MVSENSNTSVAYVASNLILKLSEELPMKVLRDARRRELVGVLSPKLVHARRHSRAMQ